MDVQSRKVSTSNKQRGRVPPSFWEEVHHPKLMRIPFWSWDAIKKTCVETFHHGIREISSWWKGSPSRSFLHESKLFASTSWTPLPQLDTSGFRIGEKDSVSFRRKNLLHVPRTGVQPFHWCDKGWNDITFRLSSHSYSCNYCETSLSSHLNILSHSVQLSHFQEPGPSRAELSQHLWRQGRGSVQRPTGANGGDFGRPPGSHGGIFGADGECHAGVGQPRSFFRHQREFSHGLVP